MTDPAKSDEKKPSSDEQERSWWSSHQLAVVAALSGLATALAAVLTALFQIGVLGGGGSSPEARVPSAATTDGSATSSNAGPAVHPLTRLLFEDSLEDTSVGWVTGPAGACNFQMGESGYQVAVSDAFSFCPAPVNFSPKLTSLRTARVEADVSWVVLPATSYKNYGPGSIGLRCRGKGGGATGDGYYAEVSTTGYWELNRAKGGKILTLRGANEVRFEMIRGETKRLRLDCVDEQGGIQLSFSVDGQLLGAFTDTSPLPPGDVGLVVHAFTKEPVEAAFSRVRVYGPAD